MWSLFKRTRMPALSTFFGQRHSHQPINITSDLVQIPARTKANEYILECNIGSQVVYFQLSSNTNPLHPFRLEEL